VTTVSGIAAQVDGTVAVLRLVLRRVRVLGDSRPSLSL
jgi:hypothetical protein